jgi:2-octaprenyl-6-methoxyphenol hydroxylase
LPTSKRCAAVPRPDLDLAIVGAGPVGAALALALREARFRVTLFDAREEGERPGPDRWLAISHGSRLILERLGLWSPLALASRGLAPIELIEVAQAGGRQRTHLRAADLDLPALGYVVSYHDLCAAFDARLAAAGIEVQWGRRVHSVGATPACAWLAVGESDWSARLAVVSDGLAERAADARVHDYRQCALVADLQCAAPAHTAFERFSAGGPIALLPLTRGHALVWTLPQEQRDEMLALNDEEFFNRLARSFGVERQFFSAVGERRSFPLRFAWTANRAASRLMRLGNAAQTLHPVAGQGFNLGLRDAYELAEILRFENPEALGSERLLRNYGARRRLDRSATAAATHGLIALFAPRQSALHAAREAALALLDAVPPLKHSLMKGMIFGWH